MSTSPRELEFSYRGMPVGYFEETQYPAAPGRYRYTPYRGWGHYEMHTALSAGERPRCSFQAGGREFAFTVVNCPKYGVLELADFSAAE
jgi:hypothetical protein